MLMCSRYGYRFKTTTINRYVICPFSQILTTSLRRKWRNASMVGSRLKETGRLTSYSKARRWRNYVPAKQTISGFLYTHENGGLKFLTFGLIGADRHWLFRFIVPVTGVQYAVQNVDFSKLYPAGTIEDLALTNFETSWKTCSVVLPAKLERRMVIPLTWSSWATAWTRSFLLLRGDGV